MIWPFKRREVGPCVECRWHESGRITEHLCGHPSVRLHFYPVEGTPASCMVARANGAISGPCADGVLFESKASATPRGDR